MKNAKKRKTPEQKIRRYNKIEQRHLIRYGKPDPALPAVVEVVGHSFPDSGYHVAKLKHTTSMFEYVLSGKGYILYQDKRYTVNAGDMIFMRQGISVNYGADTDDPYEKLWVTCRGPMIEMLSDDCFPDAELYVCHDAAADIFRKTEKTAAGQPDEKLLLHLLVDLFLQMKEAGARPLTEEIQAGAANEKKGRYSPELLKHYMDEQIMLMPKLSGFNQHVSNRHIIRTFHASYGTTPMAYLREKRFAVAVQYLTDTEMSVKEISMIFGYTSPNHFSSAFKKRFGVSPKEYRKRYRSETADAAEEKEKE